MCPPFILNPSLLLLQRISMFWFRRLEDEPQLSKTRPQRLRSVRYRGTAGVWLRAIDTVMINICRIQFPERKNQLLASASGVAVCRPGGESGSIVKTNYALATGSNSFFAGNTALNTNLIVSLRLRSVDSWEHESGDIDLDV